VPAKQGIRLAEVPAVPPAGEQSRETGEERTVRRLKCWAADLAAEHGHLVAK
jgi:hypothetical protein